jgi:glutamate dehydrogenase (NAD(P)+)
MIDSGATRLLCVETRGEKLGYVAIDSSIGASARGGLRLVNNLSETEIGDAAHAMTLKYGLLGLSLGGAKAGVIGDPDASFDEKRERLLAFGRAIEPMLRSREYIPDADLGTSAQDIRWMIETLGLPVQYREWRDNRSGYWTACSVTGAIKGALEFQGDSLKGKTAAIEGYGAVGSALARKLSDNGARIVAISTSLGAIYDPGGINLDQLEQLVRTHRHRAVLEYPARLMPCESLFGLDVDVLCPCARNASIHTANAAAVKASLVGPGANNPITAASELILRDRGVLVLPDFVSNCGGVLGGTMSFASVPPRRIARFVEERVAETTNKLLAMARHSGDSMRTVAERVAMERFERNRSSSGNRSRLFVLFLDYYRRGLVPGWPIGMISPVYFDRITQLGLQ